jgi:hypothetical protein
MSGWIGVDFDGTLAKYQYGEQGLGEPIPKMVDRVKKWLDEGTEVRIVTARAGHKESLGEEVHNQMIEEVKTWCKEHIGQELKVTANKDFGMLELWDDRAVQVIPNTGEALRDLIDKK